jgi:predicted PurR-regulated permease PerM
MINSFFKHIVHNQLVVGAFVIALAWFLLEIRAIIIAIFISYIIMAALSPLVDFLEQYKFPRVLAAAIAFVGTLLFLVLLIFPLFPFFVGQIHALFINLPSFVDQAAQALGVDINVRQLQTIIASEGRNLGGNALTLTGQIFGGVFSTITILVVSFYLLIEHKTVKRTIIGMFSRSLEKRVAKTISEVEDKLGAWTRGQIVLSLVIGSITWIALTLLGFEYALPLAVLAGLLEIIPTIGPIIASIPAIIVAVTISPQMTVIIILLYIAIQLLENNLLVPRIMEKAVGLNPVLIIIGVIIGSTLLGVAGALLSVPFISLVKVVIDNIHEEQAL